MRPVGQKQFRQFCIPRPRERCHRRGLQTRGRWRREKLFQQIQLGIELSWTASEEADGGYSSGFVNRLILCDAPRAGKRLLNVRQGRATRSTCRGGERI